MEEKINLQNYIDLGFKSKLEKLFNESGVPKKHRFKDLQLDWSTEFSPIQKLTGVAKKRSEVVKQIIETYIKNIDSILNNQPIRLVLKDRIENISDLFIDGTKSSGKTFLLSIIAQEAIMQGHKVKFIDWVDYLDRFHSFESRDQSESYFQDCLDVDLLIIDSVYEYSLNNSKFFSIQLDRLISHRLNEAKVTICSIDSVSGVPVFGFNWNSFSRETYRLQLPEAGAKK